MPGEPCCTYGADSLADLEAKIAYGALVKHPAWEDLIVAELNPSQPLAAAH